MSEDITCPHCGYTLNKYSKKFVDDQFFYTLRKTVFIDCMMCGKRYNIEQEGNLYNVSELPTTEAERKFKESKMEELPIYRIAKWEGENYPKYEGVDARYPEITSWLERGDTEDEIKHKYLTTFDARIEHTPENLAQVKLYTVAEYFNA